MRPLKVMQMGKPCSVNVRRFWWLFRADFVGSAAQFGYAKLEICMARSDFRIGPNGFPNG
jgi:hypothetical protein